ncbi:MAG: hypothetical protein AAF907_08970 [Planctomycetota bacterium]
MFPQDGQIAAVEVMPDDLAKIVAAWPDLPAAVKAGMVAMAESAVPANA